MFYASERKNDKIYINQREYGYIRMHEKNDKRIKCKGIDTRENTIKRRSLGSPCLFVDQSR